MAYVAARKNGHEMFQSLSGFLMRCDTIVTIPTGTRVAFQSLSGFLMRCDGLMPGLASICAVVSIPIGFSDAL